MFTPFFYLLRAAGIPISFTYIIEFYKAMDKGLATDVERLFLLMRLIFIKHVENYDVFERLFAAYFLGQTYHTELEPEDTVLSNPNFRAWLEKEIERGNLTPEVLNEMPLEELLRKFWETMLEQKEAHHGGNRWIGTGGTSPWGHSGRAEGGVRVYGQSMYKSASRVIGDRRYIDYSDRANLSAENIRQALMLLKRMVPSGPDTELNVDKTIDYTSKNGGEIELIFDRELRDRIKVMVFLDNGGYSMNPYINMVSMLFTKMRDHFKDVEFFYFHNCIYDGVFTDIYRRKFLPMAELLQKDTDARLFFVGDANMAPGELLSPYGAMMHTSAPAQPGIQFLRQIAQKFPYCVWLNPIQREFWQFESRTIHAIGEIFHMEDLTLAGLKNAVEYLQEKV